MRSKRLFTWTLAFIPLIITLIVLPMLPDKIPAHYDHNGDVTRWGSKYEMLIVPAITVIMGFFWILMEKIVLKNKEKGTQNVKVLFGGNISVSLTFTVMTIWFLYTSYTQAENIYNSEFDFIKILAICLSVSWIIIGNLLPKCKQNAVIGIRTTWTLASENVWYKTHRMGGRIFIVTGIISSLLCLFVFTGMTGLFVSMGILAVAVIPIIIYSYFIYKREG